MFCPKCSTPKSQKDTQYCTSCGMDLSELDDYFRRGTSGTRNKGVQQGIKLVLLGVILIPVWMFIGPMFPPNDRLVESAPSTTWLEQLFWILMWVSFLAGAVRLGYALTFERRRLSDKNENENVGSGDRPRSLADGAGFRPADPGGWRSTDELFDHVTSRPRTSGELR
jgi:hypothetical protein